MHHHSIAPVIDELEITGSIAWMLEINPRIGKCAKQYIFTLFLLLFQDITLGMAFLKNKTKRYLIMLKLTIIIYAIIATAFPLYSKPEKTITYKVDVKYIALRKMLFTIKPADIELSKQDSKNIWGFVMEMGYPEAIAIAFPRAF